MADTYDWDSSNPLVDHYSGSTQPQANQWGSNNGWTPPDVSGTGKWYQDTQGGYVGGGFDGNGAQFAKPTGEWTSISDYGQENALANRYDQNGNFLRSDSAAPSNHSALEGGWIPALGLLAGGLGMFGSGGLSSMFGGGSSPFAATAGIGEGAAGLAATGAETGLSALTPTSVGSFGSVAPVTAGAAAGGVGGLSSLFSGNGLSGIGDFLKNPLSTATGGLTGLQGISSLYDMYAKNKMAGEQRDRYNQIQNQISGGYAPGSPEHEMLRRKLEARDAAAGRNSQYGARAVELAGLINSQKNQALGQTQQGQNTLQSSMLGNEYGGLNSLFGYMNKSGALSKILGQ